MHTHRHTHCDVWSVMPFMKSSWQPVFHFLLGYGKHLPRDLHLSNCHISKAPQGEWICWCLPKLTHPLLQSLFQWFCILQELYISVEEAAAVEKKQREAQQCYYWIRSLKECRITSDTFHPFCIIWVFSCGFYQSRSQTSDVKVCELDFMPLWTRKPNPNL